MKNNHKRVIAHSGDKFSTKARIKSFGYAFKGLAYFFRTQHNSWIQGAAAIAAIALGYFLKINLQEWLWIIFSIGSVFAAELFNTAIEALTDLVSPEKNETAGRVKDLAAGGVLMVSFTSLLIGILIFGPKIISHF